MYVCMLQECNSQLVHTSVSAGTHIVCWMALALCACSQNITNQLELDLPWLQDSRLIHSNLFNVKCYTAKNSEQAMLRHGVAS